MSEECREEAAMPVSRLNCRCLLVEDDADHRHMLGRWLTTAGAEVTVADDGQVAIDFVAAAQQASRPFDIIFMDIKMPGMDGWETTKQLRDSGCQTSIIALTAHATVAHRRKCLDAGCNDYLAKPITAETLIAVVATHLGNRY
jgi:CheY-like chemotaxis protein